MAKVSKKKLPTLYGDPKKITRGDIIAAAKMKRGGRSNTRRMNRLEELGRVDAEKAKTSKGRRNLKAEKRRIVRELKK